MTFGRSCRAVLLTSLLAACVHKDPEPPTLTLAPTGCDAVPNLNAAKALVAGSKAVRELADVTTSNPCLRDGAGVPRLYTVFRLPPDGGYTLRVASLGGAGKAVFAPSISVLDAQGETRRRISDDMLAFRGGSLSAFFRLSPGDQYVLIASDPDKVGKGFSRTGTLESGTTMVPVGTGYVNLPYATDGTLAYVFSHTGSVSLTLEPLATATP